MNKKIIYLFLVLLIVAISLSPRFSFGMLFPRRNIDIRAEDILILIGSIVGIFYILKSDKKNFRFPPLFWPIVCLLGWGIFSVSINLFLGNIVFSTAFFYFLKEIEFFVLYFLVFYCVSNIGSSKKLIKYWLFFGIVNIFWLIYVFIFNVRWSIFYGPEAFIEPKGPFPSGGFFLMLFIFFFNLFIFYYNNLKISKTKKAFILVLCVLPALGVISSGSQASVLGMFFSIIVSLFLLFKNKINFAQFIKFIVLAVIIFCILLSVIYVLPISKRIISFKKISQDYLSGAYDTRGVILKNNLAVLSEHPIDLIFGTGIFGEAHSQYVRVILERGFIGLILFLWLMWSIIKISYNGYKEKNDLFKKGLCAGLFVATIAMLLVSVPNDAFMVVKPDEVYWFFVAMSTAVLSMSVR